MRSATGSTRPKPERSEAHVSQIWIYPIKACRGVHCDRAEVTKRGLAGDRRWMVTDASNRFLTQREEPRLCLVKPMLGDSSIGLSAPGMPALGIPQMIDAGGSHRTKIWNSECEAVEHPPGSFWFSEFLGFPSRLVCMPDHVERAVNPERGRPGDIVSFADGYPLLLTNQSSLDDLNGRLDECISMPRFRPNVVIAGLHPFAEDAFQQIQLGSVPFEMVKLCDRCAVTTVDPESGVRGREPLRTLATYRRWNGNVWFGVNLIPRGLGSISVGDPVR